MCEPVNAGVDPHDFGLLLEWEWSHDGALDRWHRRDEFLFAWCPRHTQIPAQHPRMVPIAAATGVDDPTALDPDDL